MSMRYYISTEEASFFNNNRMGYGTGIPTSGNYKVGDFIISSTQKDGIFGWVCTVSGTPGEWEVIGSGMNNGSGGGNKVVGYVNAVSFSNTRNSVEIGIDEYEKGKDFLEVHYNGLMLAEGVHYNVSSDGKSIEAIDGSWNENADDIQQMIFRVLKSEGIGLKELKNTINIDNACYEVELGIEGYNPDKDVIEVHLNGVLLVQGLDYNVSDGKIIKVDTSEAWNPYNVNGQKMFVKVMRNKAALIEPSDGSVTIDKLSPDVAEDVRAIDGLVNSISLQNNTISNIDNRIGVLEEEVDDKIANIDMSAKQDKTDNNLATNSKDIVGAINELFQNANNGKELIASAIGEPLNSEDTFSAMSNDINSLLSTFKTNMMNSGVTVENGDRFKQLIDKIKGLTEGEGNKGIRFAEGDFNGKVISVRGDSDLGWFYDTLNINLDFVPTIIFLTVSHAGGKNIVVDSRTAYNEDNYMYSYYSNKSIWLYISNIKAASFRLYSQGEYDPEITLDKWYAIGVGEEDTTLRDSLAGILENKGVEVSPDDDMASLITKVDGIKSGGLDIISATELPATGKENQICIISSNPVNKYNITTMSSFNSGNDCYDILLNTSLTEYNYLSTIGNLTYTYNISRVWLNENNCDSYYYTGTQWERLTKANLYIYKDGVFGAPCGLVSSQTTTPVQMYIQTDSSKSYYNNLAIKYIGNTIGNGIALFATNDRVDLTPYSKITFVFTPLLSNGYPLIEFGLSDDISYIYSSDWNAITDTIDIRNYDQRSVELSIDLTNINKSYYISFRIFANNNSSQPAADVYIESVMLE